MAVGALPPDFAVAAGRDHVRPQCAVERRVPLTCHLGRLRRQVVEPRQHLVIGAVGTFAVAARPVRYNGAVGMALFAPPPNLTIGVGGHRFRRQRAVSRPVPLLRQIRKGRRQIGLSGDHFPPRAVGALRAPLRSGKYRRLPAVALGAIPPEFFVAAEGHTVRREGCVALRVPLGKQVRSSLRGAVCAKCLSDRQPPPSKCKNCPCGKANGAAAIAMIHITIVTGCHCVFHALGPSGFASLPFGRFARKRNPYSVAKTHRIVLPPFSGGIIYRAFRLFPGLSGRKKQTHKQIFCGPVEICPILRFPLYFRGKYAIFAINKGSELPVSLPLLKRNMDSVFSLLFTTQAAIFPAAAGVPWHW